ncbi:hypothetical protein ACIRQQ_00225 [Streptomyces fuscichromogenes]|uniref:LexA family protein n=1 Tax=Streptomyces fuscichromogenes TaxID=1324013 RepID=UPI0038151C49
MRRQETPDLAPQQARIPGRVQEAIDAYGEAPAAREICRYVGVRSIRSTHYQLRQIEQKGTIVIERDRNRGIRFA